MQGIRLKFDLFSVQVTTEVLSVFIHLLSSKLIFSIESFCVNLFRSFYVNIFCIATKYLLSWCKYLTDVRINLVTFIDKIK